jgi:UDP-N-acetylglucosamine 2-epimerase (non-hydrolysing)
VLEQVRPDRILILGDTNSGLAAIVAARMGIPVYHMEAGNRCYDDRVPEEINRRIIDHCSTVLMPYTHRSKENLMNEGVERERIFVIGNPINEVLLRYATRIDESKALESLGLGPEGYVLGTVHRAENVDDPTRLRGLWNGLCRLPCETGLPVILSLHPRTRSRLQATGLEAADGLRLLPPLGFFDFVHLEKHAALVVTDSGTVQEECAILGIRNVTVRDVTERAETLECGSNLLAGGQPDSIVRLARTALQLEPSWIAPEEYRAESVSQTVARILLGYR